MGLVYALCQGNYEGRHPEGIKYYREFPSRLRLETPYCRECKLKKKREMGLQVEPRTQTANREVDRCR